MEKLIESQTIGLTTSYYNIGERDTLGCETGVEFLITDFLKGFANYTIQDMEDVKSDGRYRAAPEHKFNTGLDLTLNNGFNATITLHYVDDYEMTLGKIDPYILVNGRIAYMFPRKDLELAVVFYNILHDKHRECPVTGDEIGTAINISIIYKF